MGKKVLVAGAAGFIGHHMVNYLKKKNYWVRGADIKRSEYQKSAADEFFLLDLRKWKNCLKATENVEHVYNFAANMGGIGFLKTVHAAVIHDNVLIDTHMLEASHINLVKRFFFPSSACVYPRFLQEQENNKGLSEDSAYPADPDDAYGWEKLFAEQLCKSYQEDYGLETRIARLHNIYGPMGTWQGGREKSPAAICRKVTVAKNNDQIEVWGDGKQGRSYCFIDDCVEGIYRLMQSDIREPLNIGSDRLVSINNLVDIIATIAGKTIRKHYDLTEPQGVRGRNSDNEKIEKLLHWSPSISLEEGMKQTYFWIKSQIDGED